MLNEESQIEKQVFEVPHTQNALLLSENDFIHANPARAVTHAVRHNDHVIWHEEVGLVGLQKQLGTGSGVREHGPLIMRLHNAVIRVRHVVCILAAVMHE